MMREERFVSFGHHNLVFRVVTRYDMKGPEFNFHLVSKYGHKLVSDFELMPEQTLRLADAITNEVRRAQRIYDRIGGLL